MRVVYTLAALAGSFALSGAQITSGPDGSIMCPETPVNASYCAGSSLSTNIIIRCDGRKGVPGNCNDNLAGVDPVGVKTFAPCYQSSPEAGDAACSYSGTVYANNGTTFPVPGYSGSSSKPAYVAPYPTNLAPTEAAGAAGIVRSVASSIPASFGSYASSPAGSFTSKVPAPSATAGSIQPSVLPSVLSSIQPSVKPSISGSITATGSSPASFSSATSTQTASTSSLPTPLPGNGASGLQSSRWGIVAGVIAAAFGVGTLL